MSKFVSLEGLHGVGKSTVAAMVADRMGLSLTPTIPDAFSSARRCVNDGTCIEARFMFFLAATLSAGETIQEKNRKGEDVIVESYIFRSIAFHEGMGSEITVSLQSSFFLPSHTVLLLCDPEVRARRLKERGGLRNKWDIRSELCADAILARYQAFGFKTIDTTNLQPNQVTDRVMEIINEKP